MADDVLSTFGTRRTRQTEQAKPGQVANNEGGYVFAVTPIERVRRFLVLGTDAGTYYTNARALTRDNAQAVIALAETDHKALVDTIVDVSVRGAAPRQNPTLFALAIAASVGDAGERGYALDQLPRVARTGTHLFLFARYVEQFRGWGPALRRAVAGWYTGKPADRLAYQVTKYRQREGWSHRDLLRLAHPTTSDPAVDAVFEWITHASTGADAPSLIHGFQAAQAPGADVPALVREFGLSWEMLPSDALNDPKVWDALLDAGMGATALMRQLPRLTRLGLLPAFGGRTVEVAERLADPELLRRGRVHPLAVLTARRTYASGRGDKGSSTWVPSARIVDALDAGFYAAFGAVEAAGSRTMLALDVSGSMSWGRIAGSPLTPREASAALALVQLATEPDSAAFAFTSSGGFGRRGISSLALSPRQRLGDAVSAVSGLPFGGTDCALPMIHARKNRLAVDTFVVHTDNDTWAGDVQPFQALRDYRESTGIAARLVVVGMTATGFTIADPSDAGMMDVVGFDVSTPQVIADFSRTTA